MTDRDCANCKHHTEDGCSSWDCEYKPKDLISRADAIEAVKETKPIVRSTERNWGKMIAEQHSKELVKALKSLPSAAAAQGWIPCSERLPSKDGDYLVCMAWTYSNINVLHWADGWNCCRNYDGKISRESEIDGADIIAWMPLPKPYREDGE